MQYYISLQCERGNYYKPCLTKEAPNKHWLLIVLGLIKAEDARTNNFCKTIKIYGKDTGTSRYLVKSPAHRGKPNIPIQIRQNILCLKVIHKHTKTNTLQKLN